MLSVEPPKIAPELRARYRELGYWSRPTVAFYVEKHGTENPDRLAVTDASGSQLTYKELNQAVIGAGSWFLSQGLVKGDSVVFALKNEIDYALAHIAASRVGIVSVMLSAREGKRDVLHAQQATESKMVLISKGEAVQGIFELFESQTVQSTYKPAVFVVDPDGSGPVEKDSEPLNYWPGWRYFINLGSSLTSSSVAIHTPEPDDLEMVVFSSGTTGQPKGIAHTYDGTGASLSNWIEELKLTSEDTVFCPATLGHVGGSQWGLRTAMVIGAPLILIHKWEPAVVIQQIYKFKCRYTLVTPTFLVDLMNLSDSDRELLASFRLWAVGGSGMSREFIIRSESKLPGVVLRGFGMSEHFMSTITRADDPIEKRRDCDGRVLPGCEIQVWNENGQEVPFGEPGDMAVRGPSTVGGYFTHPEETLRSYVNGWQLTGDIITIDKEGFIKVVGRKKEIIIRGGENISPQEIENVIMRVPEIPPFLVVSVPDERLGERVGFVYEGSTGECTFEQILKILSDADVAKYKWPEVLISVEKLPRTALGKIKRGAVRNAVLSDFKEEDLVVLARETR